MPLRQDAPNYSPFAWFYNRYLNADYHSRAMAILERILLPLVPEHARILDLCCGTGHLTQILAERGYCMTGVDLSEEMLRYARKKVPGAKFLCADAREFHLLEQFHAVISTFDSLNHLLSVDDLECVFRRVHAVLLEGGCLVFDLNTREAYETQWDKSGAFIEEDHAYFVRGGFDPKKRLGRTEITMFRRLKHWQRHDTLFLQRCHSLSEVRRALQNAGFHAVHSFRAQQDLNMTGNLSVGRVFFRAHKRG